MNEIYPVNSAIILTDDIFELYGGHLGDSLPAQRNVAYWLSEMTATNDIGTFLLPVKVTGTYAYNPAYKHVMTDYSYVHELHVVRFLDFEGTCYWAITGTNNVYVSIRDDTYGIIDLGYLSGNCACHGHGSPYPYKYQLIYTAGLPTGTANQPDVLMGLVTYAELMLNEIRGHGNESPGDVGVQSFSNQQYMEVRTKLLQTTFGSSARANFVHRLFTRLRKRKWVGL